MLISCRDGSKHDLKAGSKSNRWSLDKGYSEKAGRDAFPRRAFLSGMNGGFIFIGATLDSDSKYSCNAPFTGYKVWSFTVVTIKLVTHRCLDFCLRYLTPLIFTLDLNTTLFPLNLQ